MKKYQIEIKGKQIEIIQDDDGKFIKPEYVKEQEQFGTTLKPAYEPIIMARKPVEGTVADNMLKYGVGGINIDECRVENNLHEEIGRNNKKGSYTSSRTMGVSSTPAVDRTGRTNLGRFPANVITDGSDEVKANMPFTKSSGGQTTMPNFKDSKDTHLSFGQNEKPLSRLTNDTTYTNDEGSACRYFYCAKASKKDRDEGLEEFNEFYTLKEDTPQEIKESILKSLTM